MTIVNYYQIPSFDTFYQDFQPGIVMVVTELIYFSHHFLDFG